MKIAFVNTGRYTGNQGIKSFSDPIHLVAMHNLCKEAGHQSRIFQLGYPTPEQSIEQIVTFGPQVLGLSFLAPRKDDIELVGALMRPFQKKGVHLYFGGPDVSFDRKFYATRFSWESPENWGSITLVQGDGEHLINAIIPYDFDLRHPKARKALLEKGALVSEEDGIQFVGGLKPMKLDLQGFERDYDITPFNGKLGAKWSTGCWAACDFCPNIPGRSDYKSPTRVREEVQHIIDMGVQKIDVASPQFTAHPTKVAETLAALPENTPEIFFSSRIDSLYHSINRHKDVWTTFAHATTHGIGLGVDSFIPERVLRLKKYHKMAQAKKQNEQLDAVLDFFEDTKVGIVFYLIPLDWEMHLDEVEYELEMALRYMNRYPNIIQVSPEILTTYVSPSVGSHYSSYMQPMDFLRFKKDPRLLLLLYSLYFMLDILYETTEEFDEPFPLMEQAVTRSIARFGLECIRTIRKLPFEGMEIEHSLSLIKDVLDRIFVKEELNFDSNEILRRLLQEAPKKAENKMNKFLARHEKKARKLLAKEYDQMLTLKALCKMRAQGKMSHEHVAKVMKRYQL